MQPVEEAVNFPVRPLTRADGGLIIKLNLLAMGQVLFPPLSPV
jgi:hypothetical protein